MSGNLALHLQEELARTAPRGWQVVGKEWPLLAKHVSDQAGYAPAADLCVENAASKQRIWVEFEISRADPVANHVKFAAAQLFKKWEDTDTFVAMVSPHVTRGRRTLAAHTIVLMRQLGMRAHQTVLFPSASGDDIARLNHMPIADLRRVCPPVEPEWQRLLAVAHPVAENSRYRLHFAGDPSVVGWNVHRWNEEIVNTNCELLWRGQRGHRTIEHFTWWPRAGLFAPTKFTAFVPTNDGLGMSMALYAHLDESEPRFDGHVAWKHLARIGFEKVDVADDERVARAFRDWHARVADVVRLRGGRPVIWKPPPWA